MFFRTVFNKLICKIKWSQIVITFIPKIKSSFYHQIPSYSKI